MNFANILKYFTPKEKKFYGMFNLVADNIIEASVEFNKLINLPTFEERKEVGIRIKEIEKRGDDLTYTIFEELHKTFITPFDREDIHELASAMDELEFQRQQEIYISAPADLAELWLEPRLVSFRQANPQILIYVNGVKETPGRRNIDCEIYFGQSSNKQHSDILFRDFVVPIGSPLNVERLSRTDAETRVEGFPILHIDFYDGDPADLSWVKWVKQHAIQRTAPERGMRFQS